MSTPLSTAGPRPGADAWHELEEVLAELAQLARTPLEPEAFYQRALAECVRALSAAGGAVWLRAPGGALRPAAQLQWPAAQLADNADAREAHEALLTRAANADRVLAVAAESAMPLLVAPVRFTPDASLAAAATVAIIELVPRPDASPAAHRGYEQFLTAVCDIAADYHAARELARLRQDENYRDQLVRLASLVHRHIDLVPTAYAVANEGRRVVGCDRLSVLDGAGRSCRLLAASGASRVERRGAAARQLEQLAELVRPTGDAAYYADGQSDALPPIDEALEAHAEASHARQIAILPLAPPPNPDDLAHAPERPQFVLIAEQFDARHGELARGRLAEVGALCATALYNAREVEQLPLRWLLRPLGTAKRAVVTHMTRSATVAAIAAAIVAALVLIPAEFAVDATGTLQPAVRRDLFAPRSGLVDTVLVAAGTDVVAGQPLVELRDPTLELELKRVAGEMETVRRQLEAVRATKTNRDVRDASPTELYRLSASEREFDQQLTNLRRERDLLEAERASLVVRSPIAGQVLTWDLVSRLAARPVERGEVLLTVADLDADWQLELDVADDRIGHVLAARQETDAPLAVEFRLRSQDEPYTGHVERIGMTADVLPQADAAATPTVLVTAAFDKSQLDADAQRELRPGVSAQAEINCGRRALGYVWFHDLWDALVTWLRF